MGAMAGLSRWGTLASVLALALLLLMPSIPSARASDNLAIKPATEQSALEYDPSLLFRNGTVFGDFGRTVVLDKGTYGFAVGDLNSDGINDLVTISSVTKSLLIHYRSADGTFSTPPQRITRDDWKDLQSVAIGNLDADPGADIAVSCNSTAGNPRLAIFYQTSGFNPSSGEFLELYRNSPHEVRIGHFVSESWNSVAVVCEHNPSSATDDEVDIWSPPFESTDIMPIPLSGSGFKRSFYLASADLDGDGLTDLAIAERTGQNVTTITHLPTGDWGTIQKNTVLTVPSDIELADLNSDGVPDLAVVSPSNSYVYVYLNDGHGFSSWPDYPGLISTQSEVTSSVIGDMSGDGVNDVLTMSSSRANLSAFFYRPETHSYASSPNVSIDVNSRPIGGCVDSSLPSAKILYVLCAGDGVVNSTVEVFPIRGALVGTSDLTAFTGIKKPGALAVGRMANGARLIASALNDSEEIEILNPATGATHILPVQLGPSCLAFGSFDGDMNDDLAVLNKVSGTVSLYKGSDLLTGTSPFLNLPIGIPGATSIARVSVRGGSYDDIIVGSSNGAIVYYNTEGPSIFSESSNETIATSVSGRLREIRVCDLNGDGIGADLALLNADRSTVEMVFRSSTGTVGSYYPSNPSLELSFSGSPLDIAIGNFGGDSKIDLAVLNNSGSVFVFIQPHAGFAVAIPPAATLTIPGLPSSICSGDLNDDGKDDFAVACAASAMIRTYLRTGDHVFSNSFNWTSGGPSSDLIACYANNDSRVDIVSASPTSYSIDAWYQRNLAPHAVASASTHGTVEGNDITFYATGSLDSYSDLQNLDYNWTFGPNEWSNDEIAVHRFLTQGDYDVWLRVTDSGKLSDSASVTIHIDDGSPVADFTPPVSPVEGTPAHFVNVSESYPDRIVSCYWTFGDGGHSDEGNPDHVFNHNGSFEVTLEVTDNDGSTDSITRTVVVQDTSPSAAFSWSPDSIDEGQSFTFTDHSTYPYDPIVSWLWDFGDGYTNTSQTCSHVFTYSGTFSVRLKVADSDSNATVAHDVFVADIPPEAEFTCSNSTPVEGQIVQFFDASEGHDRLSWHWDFGDGAASEDQNPTHAYQKNRTLPYVVVLTVEEDDGDTDSFSMDIHVQDTVPTVDFSWTHDRREGQEVEFTDLCLAHDGIVSWHWDFGDGNNSTAKNCTHVYLQCGPHTVTLSVVNREGGSNTSQKPIYIDKRPVIFSVVAQKYTFNEDEVAQIDVSATKGSYDITHYQFDFSYDGTFNVDIDTMTNHASMKYTKMGFYRIVVRVCDDHGYNQSTSSLLLEIHDPAPVARFSYTNYSVNTLELNASSSSDTSSDVDNLAYSWNFHDGSGFTSYSLNMAIRHVFQYEGVYNVTLNVRDDEGEVGTTYRLITIDRTPPSVTLMEIAGSTNTGQAVTISANVNDTYSLHPSVWLHYKIDNGTEHIVQMTPQGTDTNFEAEIPGVNRTATIEYWIVAFDDSQNNRTTSPQFITVIVPFDASVLVALILVALAAVLLLLFLRSSRVAVDEVFIIYEDGRLIAHQTRRLKPGMDDEILSSMLIAIQSFVKDSFKDEQATHLQRLDFGEKKILVEKGDHIFIAVVLHGEYPGAVPKKMKQVIESVEADHGETLAGWDGDLERLRGVKDLTGPLIGGKIEKNGKAAVEECPACGSPVGPNDETCPACGASLKSGELEDLEAVASDLSEKKE